MTNLTKATLSILLLLSASMVSFAANVDKDALRKSINRKVDKADSSAFSEIYSIRDASKADGDEELYWWSLYKETSLLNGTGRKSDALLLLREMEHMLDKENSIIGRTYLHYGLGQFYMLRNDYSLAIPEYRLAFEHEIFDKGIDVGAHLAVARCYYGLYMCEEGVKEIDELLKRNLSKSQRGKALGLKCLCYGFMEDRENFIKTYRSMDICPIKADSVLVAGYATVFLENRLPDFERTTKILADVKELKLEYLTNRAMGRYEESLRSFEEFNIILNKAASESGRKNVDLMDMVLRAKEIEAEQSRMQTHYARVLAMAAICILILLAVAAVLITGIIRKKNMQVMAANTAKTNFVQNIAHDVRTPLNAVVGFSQLLSLPPDLLTDEERKTYTEFIEANSQLLTILIDDVLSISDMEHNNLSVSIAECDPDALGRQAVMTCQHRCKAGVEMSYKSDIPQGTMLRTDPNRALQVLINFLSNATKNTTEGSIELRSSLSDNPGSLTYAVTDTGCGIPEDKRALIFERFVKIDPDKQGSGLGLSICSQIADKLGARVALDPEYDKGARFLFILPLES